MRLVQITNSYLFNRYEEESEKYLFGIIHDVSKTSPCTNDDNEFECYAYDGITKYTDFDNDGYTSLRGDEISVLKDY